MPLTRRTVLAAMSAAGATVAVSSTPALAIAGSPSVTIDRATRTIRFSAPVARAELRSALKKLSIPHRWIRPDSVTLKEWTISTPKLARGFGWSTVDSSGNTLEAWAELNIDTFDSAREFEMSIDGDVVATDQQRVHFRCEHYPRVRILDLSSGGRGSDHLQLIAQGGPAARCHHLAAVA